MENNNLGRKYRLIFGGGKRNMYHVGSNLTFIDFC